MARAFLVEPGVALRREFDEINPRRDRRSDGWIADEHHRVKISNHNPLSDGAVLALDVDVDGVPMAAIVAYVVAECRAGRETRLQYVIFNRTIWSRSWGWKARKYHGANPHTLHAHFSFRDGAHGRKAGSWGIAAKFAGKALPGKKAVPSKSGKAAAHPAGSRRLALRDPAMSGADVRFVQDWIGERWCGPADGEYGPRTVAGVKRYQKMRGIAADGIVGPTTWRHLGVKWTGQK